MCVCVCGACVCTHVLVCVCECMCVYVCMSVTLPKCMGKCLVMYGLPTHEGRLSPQSGMACTFQFCSYLYVPVVRETFV